MVEGLIPERDRHNVVLWSFLIGSVVIVVVVRSFSGEGVSALDWVAVSIAASAVGGYAFYAWWVSRSGELSIGRDQAGDNAYYIGLLLTFASLGVALVKLVVLIDADAQSGERQMAVAGQVAQLIPDFGVALASTVFGIAARLWLQQQRMSSVEAGEDARRELERGVAQFSASLRLATGVMSTSVIAIRLGVAKQLEEAAYGQVESFEEAQELVRDAATEMARGLTDLSLQLAEVNAKVGDELSKLQGVQPAQALAELANRSRAASGAVAELLDEVGKASKQAGGLSGEVEALQKRLAAVASGDDTARLKDTIQRTVLEAERANGAIAQADLQTSSANALLEKAVDNARTLEAMTGVAAKTVSEAQTAFDAAHDAARTVEGGLEAAKDNVRGVQVELRTASANVVNVVKETRGAASALTTEASAVANDLRKLEEMLQLLEREMSNAQPDLTEFTRRLSTLLPGEQAEEFRDALANAHQRLEQLGKQTDGDTVADEIVRALDKRLGNIEEKLTAPATKSAVIEATPQSRDTRMGGSWLGKIWPWKQ